MKAGLIVCSSLLILMSCTTNSRKDIPVDNVAIANKFIDAFYSFNRDSLESTLANAKQSQPNILYYQKWAECGHYQVLKRDNIHAKNDSIVICPVTVKDDLMAALNMDFNVTDTFKVTIVKGQIRSVDNSSNDPVIYYEAKEWTKQNRPDYIEKPCEGIWNGGPTPCECIQGMIKGLAEFAATQKSN